MSGHVEHRQAGDDLVHRVGDLGAERARHHHVGEQESHGRAGPRQLDRLAAIRCFDHAIAVHLQRATCDAADSVLVLDEQHDVAARAGHGSLGPDRRLRLGCPRQVDGERRALAGRALHPHVAVALLGDAVHGREPEPGALPRRLGGEERVEDARLGLRVHPDAVVRHVEPHVLPRCGGDPPAGELVVQRGVARRDRDAAARLVGDGVARIDREVEDELLDLPRIGVHEAERRIELEPQLAALADEQPEDAPEVAHARVEVDALGPEELAPAECQELRRERGGAVGGFPDLVHELVRLVGGRDRHLQQRREPLDRREQVVEVVRDAAGEEAHRLHLLRRPELRLDAARPGLVPPVDGHHVADDHRVDLEPAVARLVVEVEVHGPVPRAHAAELIGRRRVLERREHGPDRSAEQLGGHEADARDGGPRPRVEEGDPPLLVEQHERVTQPLHERQLGWDGHVVCRAVGRHSRGRHVV